MTMPKKDFNKWNSLKKKLDRRVDAPFYHAREAGWCSLGVNIGFEQDGTGLNFDRPILIIRGFNKKVLFGVALTGRKRVGKYYYYLGKIEKRDASVILSQARVIDSNRLIRKIGIVEKKVFKKVKECLKKTLLG